MNLERMIAVSVLGLFGYVKAFGEGTPCMTFQFEPMGYAISFIMLGGSVISVALWAWEAVEDSAWWRVSK